tara:strand:- start:33978 stop:34487 length:510 start_codon:yes stop_codon:yes gene_type:complete
MPDNRFDKGYLNYIQNQNKPKYNKFTRKAKKEYGDDFDLTEQGYMNLFDETRPGQQYYTPPVERTPVLDEYGNIISANIEGDPREPGAPFDPSYNSQWNPRDQNPLSRENRRSPGTPPTMYSRNPPVWPEPRNMGGIKRFGGEVLSSFKSASRLDQPSYKKNPGRRTKG